MVIPSTTLVSNKRIKRMSDLEVNNYITIPSQEFLFSFARSSGPGGQNVNKVNSKAILNWDITRSSSVSESVKSRFLVLFKGKVNQEGVLVLSSDESRDQKRNIEICLEKLRKMLIQAATPIKSRKPTKPTKASKEKRHKEKSQRSETKRNRAKISC